MLRCSLLVALLLSAFACNLWADAEPAKPASPQECYDECQKDMMTADVTQEQADANCRARCGLPPKPTTQPAPPASTP